MRPIVHPMRTCVKDVYHHCVIPHIHPSQTIIRHNYIYQHQHMFPHTVRNVMGPVHQVHTVVPPTRNW
ncbi:CotD family spore coat protein [Ammoniphilus sp. YIM 78166]|uniref:CotD family spore coat protein n=1 Tax=Ammoniphilus sp. YIM 78166 TaxID=1644106 RepID=UPI00106F8586|nr:CotD family spore coat protein [Ammoniphilus sp. YIM 78166]